MKKLIGTLAAALLAAAVFADIGLGGFGRGIFAPITWDGTSKKVQMLNIAGWGYGGPRVGLSFGGASDNVGFGLDVKGDSGAIALNDNAFIWAKPCDWFKISIGQMYDDTLRGNICFGNFDWLRINNTAIGEDFTFIRIYNTMNGSGVFGAGNDQPLKGVILSLMPVDGLYIAAGLNWGNERSTVKVTDNGKPDYDGGTVLGETVEENVSRYGAYGIVDILKQGQYVVGYTVDAVVAVKAQYIGHGANGTINVAADILAIEGSKISIGAFIPTDIKNGHEVAIGASYSGAFDEVSLNAYVGAKLPTNNAKKTTVDVGVGVGYGLGDGMSIEGDVRANIGLPNGGKAGGVITVGAYFNKGFSNGGLGIGAIAGIAFGGETAYCGGQYYGNNVSSDKAIISIPVRVQYWF